MDARVVEKIPWEASARKAGAARGAVSGIFVRGATADIFAQYLRRALTLILSPQYL